MMTSMAPAAALPLLSVLFLACTWELTEFDIVYFQKLDFLFHLSFSSGLDVDVDLNFFIKCNNDG